MSVAGTVVATVLLVVSAAPAVGRGPVPRPLRVGGLADVELFPGAEVGARAHFEAVNRSGGIDGRPIEFLGVRDAGRDPATAVAETRALVDDRVDAVVPVETTRFTDDGTLADAGIPAFGWGIAGGFCGNRWAFAITGCRAPLLPRQVPAIWGTLVASILRTRGVHTPTAAIVTESAAVPRSLEELRAVVEAAGMRVTYAEASLGTGDEAAADVATVADALLASGARPPSAVFVVAGFGAVGVLQDMLRVRGYSGVMTNLVQYSPALVVPARGAYVLTEFATPESAASNPAMQRILEELAAVTPDAATPSMIAGWLSADLWVRARRAAGPDASPARVARVAARLRYRVPRTIGPTDYPGAFVRPTSCGQLVTSDGTAFSVAVPYRCAGYVRVR